LHCNASYVLQLLSLNNVVDEQIEFPGRSAN